MLDSLNRLKRREAVLLQSIEELRQSLRAAGYQNFDCETAVEALRRWLIRGESDLPIEERQEIVRQFITGITVGHDTLTVRARMPAVKTASEPVAERVWAVQTRSRASTPSIRSVADHVDQEVRPEPPRVHIVTHRPRQGA